MKGQEKSKDEWLAFVWPGVHLHQGYPSAKAWWYDFPRFGAPLSKMALTYSRGTMSYFVIQKEFESYGRKLFEEVKSNPEIIFSVLEKVNQAAKKIFSLENKFRSSKFAKLSDKKLITLQRELFHWDEILWRKGQIQNLLELHNNYLSMYIRDVIKKTFGAGKVAEYFQILSAGEYKSMSERQDEDFAKLVEKAKSSGIKNNNTIRLIKKHAEKYAWMLYGWMGPALDEKYFRDNIKAALKNKKLVSEVEKRNSVPEKIIRKRNTILHKFSEKDRKLSLLLRKLLEAKARRVDSHSLTYFLGDQIYAEIGRRNFVTLNQLRAIPPKEVPKIFRKADFHRLNAEYNFVMYWYEKGKGVKKLVGETGRKKFKYISDRLPKVKPVDIIKGEMAFLGKKTGKARVILERADFSKFRKGEILVTRMTDPSYVPLMKISRAIVTDIGGITCHAAIVSRELRKPCVIGTKIATKVLRDEDLVEINADEGLVKIVKRK